MVLFDGVTQQPAAIEVLRRARASGRLAHAHLFWGPEGVGKTRAALGLAQALLCPREPAPCGACVECQRVSRLTHPDLHLVLPATRSEAGDATAALAAYATDPRACLRLPRQATIGIERVRGLKLESSKASVERGNRVIVVREAERLTPEAAQAALKLIEEPRAGTYLVLTAEDPSHLLPTIVSRCQPLRFRPLPLAFLAETVGERCGLDAARARLVAAMAEGSLSRALALAEGDAADLRDRAIALFEEPAADAAEVARRVQALAGTWEAEAARRTADLLMTWYRDLAAVKAGLASGTLVHEDRAGELRGAGDEPTFAEIRRRIAILEEMLQAIEQNVNPAAALQAALLRRHRLVGEHPVF
jgi:DNA polymerase-3 subunit delta'